MKISRQIQDIQDSLKDHAWYQVVMRYFTDNVEIRAAALAYYFLFSVFPLAALFSSIISLMHIDLNAFTQSLKPFLPKSMLNLIVNYLFYVDHESSASILSFSIIFSIYFPWRAVKGLMFDIRASFRQSNKQKPHLFLFRELFSTLIIPFAFTISLGLVIVGRNLIEDVIAWLPPGTINISDFVLTLWQYLRFILAALIMSFALTFIYEVSLDHPLRLKDIFPGTLAAILVWILACMLFSEYVENFANYTVIYGTLGGIIVLLLWLYLSGIIFIMGAELNAVLAERRRSFALHRDFAVKDRLRLETEELEEAKDKEEKRHRHILGVEKPLEDPIVLKIADAPAQDEAKDDSKLKTAEDSKT